MDAGEEGGARHTGGIGGGTVCLRTGASLAAAAHVDVGAAGTDSGGIRGGSGSDRTGGVRLGDQVQRGGVGRVARPPTVGSAVAAAGGSGSEIGPPLAEGRRQLIGAKGRLVNHGGVLRVVRRVGSLRPVAAIGLRATHAAATPSEDRRGRTRGIQKTISVHRLPNAGRSEGA